MIETKGELAIEIHERRGRRYVAVADGVELILGRDAELSSVVIEDESISRRHLRVRGKADCVEVEDLDSRHGTFTAHGVRLTKAIDLCPGEAVIAGETELRIVRRAPESGGGDLLALKRNIHGELLRRLDVRRGTPLAGGGEALVAQVDRALKAIVDGLGEQIPTAAQRARLIKEVRDEAIGLGAIQDALNDATVSEVMVVDRDHIYVERNGKIQKLELTFSSDDAIRAVIERIVTPLGRRIDEASPIVDARLKDGSRVNAVIPPLALKGPCITIRKFGKKALSIEDLIDKGALSPEMAELLRLAVASRKNIVVSGGTGSGKTTLLNVLSCFIGADERVVTIEDAAELRLAQEHVVSMETRPPNLENSGAVTIRDLVKNALRMRPDRIIVGECRGGEAIDMLQAMNTGHDGSMTTIHANAPEEAVTRLESMVLISGSELPLASVRRQIADGVQVIVQQARFSDGTRKITHISEVVGLGDRGEIRVRDLFVFRPSAGSTPERVVGAHRSTGWIASFYGELMVKGLLRETKEAKV